LMENDLVTMNQLDNLIEMFLNGTIVDSIDMEDEGDEDDFNDDPEESD